MTIKELMNGVSFLPKNFCFVEGEGEGGGSGEGSGAEGGGGGTPTSPPGSSTTFHELISEDLRENESLKKFNAVDELAKSYVNLEKTMGNSVRIPGEDASQEDWDNFYTKLGRPESPDGYELSNWEHPKGFVANEEMQSAFKTKAHELGLSAKATDELNKWYGEQINSMAENVYGDIERKRTEAIETVKKEWGQAFQEKADRVKKVFEQFAGSEAAQYMDESGMGNDPFLLKFVDAVAEAMGEDSVEGAGRGSNTLTPAQAKEEISKKYKDAEFMKVYQDKNHPEHKEKFEELKRLFNLAHPEGN